MSEIGNKALLRARAERLQMLDQRVYPQQLATDRVIPVQEVDPITPTPLGAQTVSYATDIRDLSALSTDDWEVMPAVSGFHSIVQSLDLVFSIPIDVASDPFAIRAYLQLPVGQPFPILNILDAYRSNSAAAVQARFNLRGCNLGPTSGTPANGFASTWDGFIPEGVPLRVDIAKASAAFPAGSTVEWRRLVWRWPVGELRPF